jgi:hypothetical protein
MTTEELYRVESYDTTTFKRIRKDYKSRQRAIAYYNRLVSKNLPTMIHVLKDRNPLFASWRVLKDEAGKDYHFGAWKPYFDEMKRRQ